MSNNECERLHRNGIIVWCPHPANRKFIVQGWIISYDHNKYIVTVRFVGRDGETTYDIIGLYTDIQSTEVYP